MDNTKEQINHIVEKVHDMDITLTKISATLDKNTESLIEHSARTTVAEKRLAIVEHHVLFVNAFVKIGSVGFGAVAAIATIYVALHESGIIHF